MKLSGEEQRTLREALRRAFPASTRKLEIVVSDADIGIVFAEYEGPYENRIHTLLDAAIGQYRLMPLLRAAIDAAPDNPELSAIAEVVSRYFRLLPGVAAGAVSTQPERVIFKNDGFQNVREWLGKLDELTRVVCRIEPQPRNEGIDGYGTGFLVAPDVILTAGHVAAGIDGSSGFWSDPKKASRVRLRFDWEYLPNGQASEGTVYALAEDFQIFLSPIGEQDFALLRIALEAGHTAGEPATFEPRAFARPVAQELDASRPLLILQHPQGEPIKLAIGSLSSRNTWPLDRVAYSVNTEGGSSGSPCLTQALEVVALHLAGSPSANHGVPMTAILAALSTSSERPRLISAGLGHLLSPTPAARMPGAKAEPAVDTGEAHVTGEVANPLAGKDQPSASKPYPKLRSYLNVLLSSIENLSIPGLSSAVPLESVWMMPTFSLGEDGTVSLHRVLINRAVAIRAPAGFGKTTLSKIVAIAIARDFLEPPGPSGQSWQSTHLGVKPGELPHFPVYVDLRRIRDFTETTSLYKDAATAFSYAEIIEFDELLKAGGTAVFILDGLDETSLENRSRVIDLIARARIDVKKSYFILTSRNFEGLSNDFAVATMVPLSVESTVKLAGKWEQAILPKNERARGFRAGVERVLVNDPGERPFETSPLVVAFLASIFVGRMGIPDNRAQLFARVSDWLLNSRSEIRLKEGIDLLTTKASLEALGYLYASGKLSASARKEQAIRASAKLTGLPATAVERAIRIETSGANCLVESSGMLDFWHISLRDYFAARWLLELFLRSPEGLPAELTMALRQGQEVGDMVIGLLIEEHSSSLPRLITETAPRGQPSIENVRAAALHARILTIAASIGHRFESKEEAEIRSRAALHLELSRDRLRGMNRADRIEALTAVGRLRLDSRLHGRPERRMISIGGDKAPSLGRFPVTVQEYGRYVKAALAEKRQGTLGSTKFQYPMDWGGQLDMLNAPVTGVDWMQASEYCKWLTDEMLMDPRSLHPIARLPTLEEWCEMVGVAASGSGGKGGHLAMAPLDVRPVGVDLEQVGIYGHEDLSNGVWEWIGPALHRKSRRRQIVSCAPNSAPSHPVWRRASGRLQSPAVGFRLVFTMRDEPQATP
jgi:hypothetical protein